MTLKDQQQTETICNAFNWKRFLGRVHSDCKNKSRSIEKCEDCHQLFSKGTWETSGQDGGVGRHALPPCTPMERITTKPQNK